MSEPKDSPLKSDDDRPLPAELRMIEQTLSSLSPRQDRLDRERLAFLAGQASVTADAKRRTLLGLNLRHEGWAAAFGAMTAVAATLLALLVTGSATVEPPPFSENLFVGAESEQRSRRSQVDRTVLSTSDVYRMTVEQLLAHNDLAPSDSTSPPDEHERPDLTPAAWNQILDLPELARPANGDSSSVHPFPGVQS